MQAGAGRGAVCTVVAVLALSAAACGHVPRAHWPWHRQSPAAPAPVHELDVSGAAGAAFPQYWMRNTLLLDLSAASGSGSITLRPASAYGWPVRLAFRVTPGAIGVLEVRAAQRTSLPIAGAGGRPVDLELAPGVYTPQTEQMTVSWAPFPPID
jgi:hypothetical protein